MSSSTTHDAELRRITAAIILVAPLSLTCCAEQADDESRATPDNEWLLAATTDAERFALVAKHLRGFDMAMVETGYRYNQLYWAGHDENWEYATYQLEKIRTAVNNGTQRRPKRHESAAMLEPALAAMDEAVGDRDRQRFLKRFDALTRTCNACHQAEDVGFMVVRTPEVRAASIHATVESEATK